MNLRRAMEHLFVVCLFGVAIGCSQGGGTGLAKWFRPTPSTDYSAPPNFNKSFEQYAAEAETNRSEGLAFTHVPDPEPAGIGKVTNYVSGSRMANGLRSAWRRGRNAVVNTVAPSDANPHDATLLSNGPIEPNAQLYAAAGDVHVQSGQTEMAIEQYQLALEKDPKHVGALIALGRLEDERDNEPKAAEYYGRAAKSAPDDASVHNDIGLWHAKKVRFDDAVTAFNEAIRLDPKKALYRNNMATVLVEMGRIDLARKHQMAVHPEAVAYYNVGFLLHGKGETARATAEFESAMKVDPTFQPAREWMQQFAADRISPSRPMRNGNAPVTARVPERVATGGPSVGGFRPGSTNNVPMLIPQSLRRGGKPRAEDLESDIPAAPLPPEAVDTEA